MLSPNLYSHSTCTTILVFQVLQDGLQSNLRNRLTLVASRELGLVSSMLQDFVPSDVTEDRYLKPGLDHHSITGWNTKVPIKLRIFGWLLLQDHLNSKANLHPKNVSDSSDCPRCQGPWEDSTHIFLTCPLVTQVWIHLGLVSPSSITIFVTRFLQVLCYVIFLVYCVSIRFFLSFFFSCLLCYLSSQAEEHFRCTTLNLVG